MTQLLDARGNEFQGALDAVANISITDARATGATLTATGQVFLDLNGKSSAIFDVRVAANAVATLVFEVSEDGSNFYQVPAFVLVTSTPGGTPLVVTAESYVSSIVLATNTITAAFMVQAAGWKKVQCRVSSYTSGSITINARAGVGESLVYIRPGSLLDTAQGVVNLPSSQLFIDTFDASFDTTNNWNTAVTGNAGVAFVFSGASITGGTGTTANGFSVNTSRQNFQPGNPGYLEIQMNIGMPDVAAPVVNSYLAWGIGSPQTVPTTANPIANGLVFERATNGKMFVAVYQSGTRVVIQDLSSSGNNTQPLTGTTHKYYMWVRGDIGFFAIDSRTNIVATFTTGALGPDITALPVFNMCVGGPTPPVSNVQLANNMTCVGDTAQSTTTLSDPQFPFRQANVKAASTAVAATDLALTVGLHPSSPMPGVGQTSTTSGQTGHLVQGAVLTAAPTYTTAQTSPLSLTTAGGLRQDIASIAGTATATVAAGTLKIGIVGSAAAAIDGAIAAVPPANALQIGIKAATANPANATAGNQVAIMGDKAGRPVVTLCQARDLVGIQTTAVAVTTADQVFVTAGAAGVFNDLTSLTLCNATAAAMTMTIKDAVGGTTRMVINLPSTIGATVISFPVPVAQAVAATAWCVTLSAATATNITATFIKNT